MVPSTVVFGATAVAIGNDPDAPSISKVLGGRPFHRSGWLFRESLKAFTLGFGQQEIVGKGVYQLLDVGNEGEQAERNCHHSEAETLDCLAAKLIHRERRDRITGRREDSEDAELSECLLQDRVVATKGPEHERARDSVAKRSVSY
jgi:hypothetical protein